MKRMDRENDLERTGELSTGLAAAETMRSAVQAAHDKEETSKKDEEKMSLFWRVFGGTIISIAALVGINLFNNLYGSLSELRTEINKEREARAELVKKDEFNARISTQYERIRSFEVMQNTLTALRSEHEALKESVKSCGSAVEGMKKETAALDSLRERMTAMEAMKKDLASLDVVKERLTALAQDLKTAREDFAKINQEISQNRVFDLERKNFRDNQAKQFEDALKDVSKGLQEVREKLARLEGQQPAPVPQPKAVKTTSRPKIIELETAPMPATITPASGTKE